MTNAIKMLLQRQSGFLQLDSTLTDSNFWNAQYFRNTPIRVTILEKSYYFNLIKVRNWSHSDNFDRLGNKLKIQFITSVILTIRHFFLSDTNLMYEIPWPRLYILLFIFEKRILLRCRYCTSSWSSHKLTCFGNCCKNQNLDIN
jgi:hypothetical protein